MGLERLKVMVTEAVRTPGPNLKFEMDLRDRLVSAYRQRVLVQRPQTEDAVEIRRYNAQVEAGQRDLLMDFGKSLGSGQGAEFVESYINPQPTAEEQ